MNLLILSFILTSVFLSVVAQILLKHGMSNSNVQTALELDALNAVITIFTNISVLGGLAAYVSSAGVLLIGF
jgi:hypothetical protein